jgi:hypothetical protein
LPAGGSQKEEVFAPIILPELVIPCEVIDVTSDDKLVTLAEIEAMLVVLIATAELNVLTAADNTVAVALKVELRVVNCEERALLYAKLELDNAVMELYKEADTVLTVALVASMAADKLMALVTLALNVAANVTCASSMIKSL